MSQLNQIMVTVRQFKNDIENLKNHKYFAHQIAVLYVSESSGVHPFRFLLTLFLFDPSAIFEPFWGCIFATQEKTA
jgi:hypothetical protein